MPSEIKPGLDARTPLLLLPVRIETRFVDSADSGPYPLVCRHGSLTSAEMLVPMLAYAP